MNKYTFMGNGRNKDFYFTFPFFSKADIVVKINGTAATGYGIFCIPGTNNYDFPFTGGHIHFASAPKSTDIVTIERKIQLNRLIDYQPTVALNPTTVNQDMNYFFELLKDIKSDLAGFAQTYSDFTDTETAQTLLTQIDAVVTEIDNLGDISTINTSLTNLGTSISNLTNSLNSLTTTVGTHTTDIATLGTSKTSTDMDNISTIGKENIVALSQPDNSAAVAITTTVNGTYTCPKDGYLFLSLYSNTASAYLAYQSSLATYVNNIYSIYQPATGNGRQAAMFAVQKGEVLTCSLSTGYNRSAYFIPKKGV
ncbi:MAG: hypothetical protein IK122_01005 [Alphaproteobacteria bacterium]|nr:hypothetical protein [Alphaproteobacteria bacterium]MBR5904532.1 hypothetical protein [Alphaproteobacteria bacterium]